MGKAEFRTTKAAMHLHVEKLATVDACSDGASLFVPFCQTKVTG
jgi:hypothetical protein